MAGRWGVDVWLKGGWGVDALGRRIACLSAEAQITDMRGAIRRASRTSATYDCFTNDSGFRCSHRSPTGDPTAMESRASLRGPIPLSGSPRDHSRSALSGRNL